MPAAKVTKVCKVHNAGCPWPSAAVLPCRHTDVPTGARCSIILAACLDWKHTHRCCKDGATLLEQLDLGDLRISRVLGRGTNASHSRYCEVNLPTDHLNGNNWPTNPQQHQCDRVKRPHLRQSTRFSPDTCQRKLSMLHCAGFSV